MTSYRLPTVLIYLQVFPLKKLCIIPYTSKYGNFSPKNVTSRSRDPVCGEIKPSRCPHWLKSSHAWHCDSIVCSRASGNWTKYIFKGGTNSIIYMYIIEKAAVGTCATVHNDWESTLFNDITLFYFVLGISIPAQQTQDVEPMWLNVSPPSTMLDQP